MAGIASSRRSSSRVPSVNRFWPAGIASAERTASSGVQAAPVIAVRRTVNASERVAP